jgi:hypothetical protein
LNVRMLRCWSPSIAQSQRETKGQKNHDHL